MIKYLLVILVAIINNHIMGRYGIETFDIIWWMVTIYSVVAVTSSHHLFKEL